MHPGEASKSNWYASKCRGCQQGSEGRPVRDGMWAWPRLVAAATTKAGERWIIKQVRKGEGALSASQRKFPIGILRAEEHAGSLLYKDTPGILHSTVEWIKQATISAGELQQDIERSSKSKARMLQLNFKHMQVRYRSEE